MCELFLEDSYDLYIAKRSLKYIVKVPSLFALQ